MLKRFLWLAVALALIVPVLADAQGLAGSGVAPGTYTATFRKTGAYVATSLNKPRHVISATGTATVATWYSDSTVIENTGTAGTMHFDTLAAFSRADLEDWTIYRTTATSVAADSLWAFTAIVRPVDSRITQSADSLTYYVDFSMDGGSSWNRAQGITSCLEIGTTNAFQIAFNLAPGYQGSDGTATQTALTFWGLDALYRLVFISDIGGRYSCELKYPRLIR